MDGHFIATRQRIEARIEELIDLLDFMDGDPDFEPMLGAPEQVPQTEWYRPSARDHDERELEDEHGGDINDEPHDDDEREFDWGEYDAPLLIWGGNGT